MGTILEFYEFIKSPGRTYARRNWYTFTACTSTASILIGKLTRKRARRGDNVK